LSLSDGACLTQIRAHGFFAVTLVLLVAATCFAEENSCPSAAAVLTATREHFPEIKVQAQKIKEAKAGLLSAKGAFDFVAKADSAARVDGFYTGDYADARIEKPLTTLGASVLSGYRSARGVFPPYEEDYRTGAGGEWFAGVQVPLLKGRAIDDRRAELAVTELLVSQATYEARAVEIQIERDAIDIYLRWRAAQGIVEVFTRLLKQAEIRLEQTTQGVAAGDRAGIDTVDANRLVLKRKALLAKSEAEVQKFGAVLSLYYRDVDGNPILLSDSNSCSALSTYAVDAVKAILALDARELSAKATEQSLFLKVLEPQLEANKVQGQLAENSLLPKVDVGVQVARDIGSGSKSTADTELKGIIKFELPLERRQAKGKQQAVTAKRIGLAQKQALVLQKIRADSEKVRVALENSVQLYQLAKAEADAARELVDAEEKRLSFGDSSLLLVNVREQTLAEAEVAVVEARAAISQALADVSMVLGEDQEAIHVE
jgi:outer membrane protein TolC